MTTNDSQEKMKEEAKAIQTRLETLIKDTDPMARIRRTIMIYGGMITETLLDYEEPDTVMEQAFHRIAELLNADPAEEIPKGFLPPAYVIDHDTELGRQLARQVAEKLPKGTDDLHEIAIALVINEVDAWEKNGISRELGMRLLVESVIMSLTFEMATQDFCDLLIEDFIADGQHTTADAVLALAAVSGSYFREAMDAGSAEVSAETDLTHVMARESLRHGTPGVKNWHGLAAANDGANQDVSGFVAELKPEMEEFFGVIGLDDPLGKAVAVAKATGRIVAVITVEEIGQIHPNIAKSLAKTGMILGTRLGDAVTQA